MSELTPLPFTSVFAFVGSGCLLVLEIVAGRLIAPNVGVSLYTWTSVIGVVLAGIAIGNYLGGKLADRRPGRTTLSMIYLGAAAASALILFFARDVDAFTGPTSWPAIIQVLWITTLMFFVPSVVLGMPTPMLVKLTLPSLDSTGRVVGDVQAAATAGQHPGRLHHGLLPDLVVRHARDRGRRGGGAAAAGGLQPSLPDRPQPRRAGGRDRNPRSRSCPAVMLVGGARAGDDGGEQVHQGEQLLLHRRRAGRERA